MRFERWVAPVDALVAAWPTGWGGRVLRLVAWKSRFRACGLGRFGDVPVISPFGGISIGDDTSQMARGRIYANDGANAVGSNCSCKLNVMLNTAGGTILIGADMLVGPNLALQAANHAFGDCDGLMRTQKHRRGTIVIGGRVWLGDYIVVTSGTRVGDGRGFGVGGVLAGDVAAMSVCIVPASALLDEGKLDGF